MKSIFFVLMLALISSSAFAKSSPKTTVICRIDRIWADAHRRTPDYEGIFTVVLVDMRDGLTPLNMGARVDEFNTLREASSRVLELKEQGICL